MPDALKDLAARWEEDPAKVVRTLIESTNVAMSSRRQAWRRWRKIYRNEWYRSIDGQAARYSANHVFSTVETTMGYVQANPPQTSVRSIGEQQDVEDAMLDALLEHEKGRAKYLHGLWQTKRHSFIIGTAFRKVRFDPELGPFGGVAFDVIPAESVIVDPWAQSWEQVRFLMHRIPNADPDEVRQRFDARKDDVKTESKGDQAFSGNKPPTAAQRENPLPKAELIEAWVRIEGAWQVAWISGDAVLKGPQENPYDHGMLPFVPHWDTEPTDCVFGVGESEMVEPLQDYDDDLIWQTRKLVRKTANRRTLVNEQLAGINASDFDDEAATIMPMADVSEHALRELQQPEFPPELQGERKSIQADIQRITGISPILSGAQQAGTRSQSGTAVAIESENAQRRMDPRLVTMRWSTQLECYQALHLIFQYYTEERIIRLATGKTVHIFPGYPDALKQQWDAAAKANAQSAAMVRQAKAQWRQQQGVDLVMSDVQVHLLDVDVETDSAMPQTKAAKANLAMQLAKLKMIDQKALLDALEWPNRDEIILRMNQQQAPQAPGQPTGGAPPAQPAQPQQAQPGPAPAGLGALQALLGGAAGPQGPQPPGQPAIPARGMVG